MTKGASSGVMGGLLSPRGARQVKPEYPHPDTFTLRFVGDSPFMGCLGRSTIQSILARAGVCSVRFSKAGFVGRISFCGGQNVNRS
jgi:hypothetical protein